MNRKSYLVGEVVVECLLQKEEGGTHGFLVPCPLSGMAVPLQHTGSTTAVILIIVLGVFKCGRYQILRDRKMNPGVFVAFLCP